MALLRSAIWCGSYGDLLPVEMALLRLRCEECQHSKVEARLVPLCEPSCRKWR